MHTCGWCGKTYVHWQSQCDACGGALPPLPGFELGPPPPAAPRRLPKGFAFRLKWAHNPVAIAGAGFTVIFGLFTLILAFQKPLVSPLPGLFLLGGIKMLIMGRREAVNTIQALVRGEAAEGRLTRVAADTTTRINDRYPWKLEYQFMVDGHAYSGTASSLDPALGQRRVGQPVWVLYLPSTPEVNTLYPPVG